MSKVRARVEVVDQGGADVHSWQRPIELHRVIEVEGDDLRRAAPLHLEGPETVTRADIETPKAGQRLGKPTFWGEPRRSYSPGVTMPPGSSMVWYQRACWTRSWIPSLIFATL